MKTYMVWAFIEEEEDDEYQDTSTPKLLGTFDNEDDSRKFVNSLAAAPDLLEACQDALDYFKVVFGEDTHSILTDTLRNAIKKAGEE